MVDNKRVAEPVLKCIPISGHTAADGTGQMPLAEKVTWVKTKASLHLGCREAEVHKELGEEKQLLCCETPD